MPARSRRSRKTSDRISSIAADISSLPLARRKEDTPAGLGETKTPEVDELEDALLIEDQSPQGGRSGGLAAGRRPAIGVHFAQADLFGQEPEAAGDPSQLGLQDDDPAAEPVGARPPFGQLGEVHDGSRRSPIDQQPGEPGGRTGQAMQVHPRQHLADMPRIDGITIRTGMTHDEQHRIAFMLTSRPAQRRERVLGLHTVNWAISWFSSSTDCRR